MVRRHLGLAHHLAGRYSGRGADRDDLAQVACFALVKAIRGFDHERGEFVPFATVTILGEIKKYFRDYCWGIRPPRRIQQMQADISSATERCLQSDSRQPDLATIAGEIDAGVDEVREAMAARSCFSPTSLDQPVRESGRPLGETIAGDTSDYEFIDDWVTIEPLCRDLDDDERRAVAAQVRRGQDAAGDRRDRRGQPDADLAPARQAPGPPQGVGNGCGRGLGPRARRSPMPVAAVALPVPLEAARGGR